MSTDEKLGSREKLEKKLRKIWENEEFVQGVICNAKTEKNWETISAFIDMSYRMGDDLASDNLVALSVVLSNETRQSEGEKDGEG